MSSQTVLIVGAGVAGSILAHSLGQNHFNVTVIERSRVEQKLGQGLEIEEPAIQVIKHMGILDQLEAIRTSETGFKLCDEHDRCRALFSVGNNGPTGNLEMMRGDMTEVFYRAADQFPNVHYEFETTVQSIQQTEKKATVVLENRAAMTSETRDFDYIIGADGSNSKTRRLVMGSPEELDCFKPVGAYVAFFDIPKTDADWPVSRLCHFPGRRVVWIRPQQHSSDRVSVHFIYTGENEKMRLANSSGDRTKQKEAMTELYGDLGWETPRILGHMKNAPNFYSDTLQQVKLARWSVGRVVLVGDSAWAPTPFTGQGNQLAIIGAWVLGQEMARHRSPAAFDAYDARLRNYVEDVQQIPLYGYSKYLFNPEARWSIFVLRTILWMVATGMNLYLSLGLDQLFNRFFPSEPKEWTGFDLQIPKGSGQ